jgi:DNA-binding MarR family transcriptional regulator
MTETTDINQAIWIGLSKAHKAALAIIESRLKQAEMPPLEWYDVLLELERAGGAGARAFELRETLLLPQYGLSRLLARIEKAGYLTRRPCEDDGRGQRLYITPPGMAARKAIWVIYRKAIEQAIDSRLSKTDADTLLRLMALLQCQPDTEGDED